jgi:hypothetical protein
MSESTPVGKEEGEQRDEVPMSEAELQGYIDASKERLHWPFTPKHDNCVECDREYEAPPNTAAAPPVPAVEPEEQVTIRDFATAEEFLDAYNEAATNAATPSVAEGESVAETAAEINRLTKWQDLCFELLSEVRLWAAPGSITDTDAPRVLRAMLRERAELKQRATPFPVDHEKRARELAEGLTAQLFEVEGFGDYGNTQQREAVFDLAQQILTTALQSSAGVDPVETETDALVHEAERRMDQVVEAAVEWHQAGREGAEWFDAAERLSAAIESLMDFRSAPAVTAECFCGTELEAGLCPNGHDPIATAPTPLEAAQQSDSRDNGCLCQRCNQRYSVDFMLPDELWAKIRGAFNLLCGKCVVELIETNPGRIEWGRITLYPRRHAASIGGDSRD